MAYTLISDLIKSLEEIKQEHGDLPLFMSSDPEGNSFGPLSPDYSHGWFHEEWYEFHDIGYFGDHEEGLEEWDEYANDDATVEGICLWP